MDVRIGRATLSIVNEDITEQSVDIITNAANNRLWMGGGVAGSIKSKGGEEIEEEAMKLGPIPIGEVVITEAGKLPQRKVFHAVVMEQDMKTSQDAIKNATMNVLKLADDNNFESIAIPAFGTGVGHFPADVCADLMLEEIINYLLETKNLKKVVISLLDNGIYEIFKNKLKNRFSKR
ncbi:macro domain-containing protein [bacterium]|nr:macro domain-containing protein [bacterium]